MKKYRYIAFALIALSVAACGLRKDYEAPELASEKLFRDTIIQDTVSIAELPYTDLFKDPVLQKLIQEGVSNNLDLKVALMRIAEAEATFRQRRSAQLPSLAAVAQVTENKQSRSALNLPSTVQIALNTRTYQFGLTTSWEIDIWGKLRNSKKSSLSTFLQSKESTLAIQTQLVANIANYYYTLLALDAQLKITLETVDKRRQDVDAMKSLLEGAVVNGAAVVQSEANLYAAQVTLPDLKQQIRETENALSVILGRVPGAIERGTLESQVPIEQIRMGVPAQLLSNRPDVRAAEFGVRAAYYNTKAAKAYFYPALTITGSGGFSSLEKNHFSLPSMFYSVIAGLTQPIFQQGLNKARLKIAQAQQEEAVFTFQKTMLTAGTEVSNALYRYENALEKQQTRALQLDALNKAVDFTRELLEYSSTTNYTDVLTSEQALLSAQLNSVNDKAQQLEAIVELYRALGGGTK